MSLYRIGPVTLKTPYRLLNYESFRVSTDEENNYKDNIEIITVYESPFNHKCELLSSIENDLSVFRCGDEIIFKKIIGDGYGSLSISDDYKLGKFYSTYQSEKAIHIRLYKSLINYLVQGRLIYEKCLILHSSCITIDGVSIAFSGPSGRGKSTRASKWVDCLEAEWVSGDKPGINVKNKSAFGVPWDGKENIHVNSIAPLSIIFEVRRSKFTYLKKITSKEAYDFLVSQIVVPMWDSQVAALALYNLKKLVNLFPVYRLYCDRTDQAAFEIYDIIKNHMNIFEIKENKIMRAKKDFEIVQIGDDYMAIPVGTMMKTFGGTVALNETSAYLLKAMKKDVSKEDLVDILLKEYIIDKEIAKQDVEEILNTFKEIGLIEELCQK